MPSTLIYRQKKRHHANFLRDALYIPLKETYTYPETFVARFDVLPSSPKCTLRSPIPTNTDCSI